MTGEISKQKNANQVINLKNRQIGARSPCYIIAEMSANHAGDINRAIEIVHAAKNAGADCIKIQTYTADTITIDSDKEYFKIKGGTWNGANLYQLYQQAHTPWEWHKKLKDEAEKAGIDFLSTPFDTTSVDFLEDLGIEFYKIASCELVDLPLIRYVASKGKPMIISTGMGSLEEIQEAVDTVRKEHNDAICLLRCSVAYPAIPKEMNLMTLKDLQERFNVVVGLSDHSMGSIAAITAVCLGAKVVEKHFCINRTIENPDSSFSMEPHEFKEMVAYIRTAEQAVGTVSYELSEKERHSKTFRKSIFVISDINIGDTFTTKNIKVIRPAHGLQPKHYESVLGKKSSMNIERGTPLNWQMVNLEL